MSADNYAAANLTQRGGLLHQSLCLFKTRVTLGQNIHGLLTDELQGIQASADDGLTLKDEGQMEKCSSWCIVWHLLISHCKSNELQFCILYIQEKRLNDILFISRLTAVLTSLLLGSKIPNQTISVGDSWLIKVNAYQGYYQ